MLTRRSLLRGASLGAAALALGGWFPHGVATVQPADATIPISTLATGNYAANNWTGFTTPASTVYNPANSGWACGSGGSNNFFEVQSDAGGLNAISTGSWRDVEITTWIHRGTLYLRMANGTALACFINGDANSCNGLVQIGTVQNFVPESGNTDFGGTGNFYWAYINQNPTATLAGYSTSYSPGDTITFGCSGFDIYLKINGTTVVSLTPQNGMTEWRVCQAGNAAVFGHTFYDVAGEISVNYLSLAPLYSDPIAGIYDIRDFGAVGLAACTGSMSASSNQLVLNSNPGFTVGQQIIVEIGGESGVGARGTAGVGGIWPALNYANATAMNADTTQATHTSCWLQSTNLVWSWNGSAWVIGNDQFPTIGYYLTQPVPLSLVATITNIAGNTLTLSKSASVATTNASVWLDCVPSFLPINQNLIPIMDGSGDGQFAPNPSNMQISIPTGTWQMSGIVGPGGASGITSGLQIYGQASSGASATTLRNPAGCTCGAFNLIELSVNNVSIQHLAYIGNFGPNGFMFNVSGNIFQSFPQSFSLNSPEAASTGLVLNDIAGTNSFGQFLWISGNGPIISNSILTLTSIQQDYIQWSFSLNSSAGNGNGSATPGTKGLIENCAIASPNLCGGFELFACTGCSMVNCGGSNCGFSNNSSTNTTFVQGLPDGTGNNVTITSLGGNPVFGTDQGIWNINTNAFGSGNTGTMLCQPGFQCIQQGYVDSNSNSYKFVTVQPAQTGWTFQGGYNPGVTACSELLGGYFQAPNYAGNPPSTEYGSMFILSQANNTTVKGIRIVGSAVSVICCGLSGYSNIDLQGTGSTVENCVADQVATGPTQSNNVTNSVYCDNDNDPLVKAA